MKKLYTVFLFIFTFNVAISQTPVIPVSATTTFIAYAGTSLTNTYNGAGLPSFPALTGNHAQVSMGNCFLASPIAGTIDFNLGSNYDIDGLSFWNFNNDPTIGLNGVAFYSSLDGVTYSAIPDAPIAFASVVTSSGDAETFTFPAVNANFIRMEVFTNHGGGFVGFSEIAFSSGNTLSMSQHEIKNINIFPNPASTHITVTGLKVSENYIIYNVLGAEVLSGTVSSTEAIDVQYFNTGLYLLRFENGETLKFIKK